MDVLTGGHGLLESPRWHDGRLWFSDWTAGQLLAVDATGAVEVMVRHESLPLCFDFLADGRTVLVSNQRLELLAVGADGALQTYADLSQHSPHGFNDIVVDGRGNAYVNSGNFDFATGPPSGEVQPGIVVLVRPDGESLVVAEDLAFPNGMAVTADNATLVVADSYRHQLVGFDIAADGRLSGRRVWADLGDGTPDGICLDAEGCAWYADVPNRSCERVREGGAVATTITLDRGGFACMLDDSGNLYVVAAHWPGMAALAQYTDWDGRVQRAPVGVVGAGWPAR